MSYLGFVPPTPLRMIQALTIQDHCPQLEVTPPPDPVEARDVLFFFEKFHQGQRDFHINDLSLAGPYVVFRASQIRGEFSFTFSQRPQSEVSSTLLSALAQLGVEALWKDSQLKIKSLEGWRLVGNGLHLPLASSAEWIPALLVNSWGLDFDLRVSLEGHGSVPEVFTWTLKWLERCGLRAEVSVDSKEIFLSKQQTCLLSQLQLEADISSIFSMVISSLSQNEELCILNFPDLNHPLETRLLEVLSHSGVRFEKTLHKLRLFRSQEPLSPSKIEMLKESLVK